MESQAAHSIGFSNVHILYRGHKCVMVFKGVGVAKEVA